MPPMETATPITKRDRTKSTIIPSTCTPRDLKDLEGVEETEITAQISLPTEGGWGWVVLTASFMVTFVLDGVYFTFGSILHDMSVDLAIGESLVALINSVSMALYYMAGPVASALINRFGFRAICMVGSILSSMGMLCTYFSSSYVAILTFYGLFGGFGSCLSGLASVLVVGFYFERLRSLAMSIAGVGSSVGIMILSSVNAEIVKQAGWRVLMLLHAGMVGSIYFYSMAFRPLLSLTVTTTVSTDTDPSRTVTYLPSLAAIKASPSSTTRDTRKESHKSTATERLFSAVSNVHFPTAAAVIGERTVPTPSSSKAGPSRAAASRFTLTAQGPQDGVSGKHLKHVQSRISKSRINVQDKNESIEKKKEISFNVDKKAPKKKWWRFFCHWEDEVSQARPMYRDDAFYAGRVDKLPAYQKSMMEVPPEQRTGLEYQMAVSRAVTAAELTEKRAVFSTAVRRILVTMMDPKLLTRLSFVLLCTSAFLTYLGYLVPYVFLADRNSSVGIPLEHCSLFVSVIGLSNAVGRLAIGVLAMKYNPVTLYLLACVISGVAIMAFNFSFNLMYQYAICAVFGFHIASLSCVRSVAIVHLYGLEMLTNGTGLMLMFHGIGCLLGTPLSSILKNEFGYTVSFYVAGIFVLISGLVLLPVCKLNEREKRKIDAATANATPASAPTPTTTPTATPSPSLTSTSKKV